MEPYVYRPLLQASNSIRLLQITPGTEGSEIHCLMFDYTIQHDRASGPYEALSYVWGDPAERRRIYVQEAGLSETFRGQAWYIDITVNLYAALQRLRDTVFTRLMWIDALCIDQENLQERAAQVQFMATIYSYASRVVVWLGEAADDSTSILAQIEKAAGEAQLRDRIGASVPGLSQLPGADQTQRPISRDAMSQESFLALMNRPWFDRVWVLQEAAAARQLLVVCGNAEVTGTAFTRGSIACMDANHMIDRNINRFVFDMMSWEILSTKLDPEQKGRPNCLNIMSLGQLLDKFHLQEASDQRDKVFALLGTCRILDGTNEPPEPDYTKTWSAVFRETIAHVFGRSATVETWNDCKQAIFTCQGYPLGRVEKVQDKDELHIVSSHLSGFMFKKGMWSDENVPHIRSIRLQTGAYCKLLKEGDILWRTAGTPYPCIIRSCADHFDVIVSCFSIETIEVSLASFSALRRRVSVPWHEFDGCTSNPQRSITLVWDWETILPHSPDDHASFLVDRWKDSSPAMRLLECARIADDLCDFNAIRRILDLSEKSVYEKGDSNYLRLLTLACKGSLAYSWLKDFIEELRWCAFRLKYNRSYLPESSSCMLEYWKSNGVLRYNAAEMAALSNASPMLATSDSNDQHYIDIVRWDFGHRRHIKLLAKFFPKHQGRDTVQHDARYLYRLVSAHYNVEESQSCFSVEKLLAENYFQERRDAVIFVGEGVGVSTPPRSFMTFLALGSELSGNKLNLTRSALMDKVYKPEASRLFSFLLAEACMDVQSMYNILAVATDMYSVWNGVETPDDAYRFWEEGHQHSQSMDEVPMGGWLISNLRPIRYYIKHTPLCEVARSHPDDTVLPTLLRLLQHKTTAESVSIPEPELIREVLLQGIYDFVMERREEGRTLGK